MLSVLSRRSSAALDSSGIPALPNNLRSQTPDGLSCSSDNRRVRVSERHAAVPEGNTSVRPLLLTPASLRRSRSPTEPRASPALSPATPRKEPRASRRPARGPPSSPCPGPLFHQVAAFNSLLSTYRGQHGTSSSGSGSVYRLSSKQRGRKLRLNDSKLNSIPGKFSRFRLNVLQVAAQLLSSPSTEHEANWQLITICSVRCEV